MTEAEKELLAAANALVLEKNMSGPEAAKAAEIALDAAAKVREVEKK